MHAGLQKLYKLSARLLCQIKLLQFMMSAIHMQTTILMCRPHIRAWLRRLCHAPLPCQTVFPSGIAAHQHVECLDELSTLIISSLCDIVYDLICTKQSWPRCTEAPKTSLLVLQCCKHIVINYILSTRPTRRRFFSKFASPRPVSHLFCIHQNVFSNCFCRHVFVCFTGLLLLVTVLWRPST